MIVPERRAAVTNSGAPHPCLCLPPWIRCRPRDQVSIQPDCSVIMVARRERWSRYFPIQKIEHLALGVRRELVYAQIAKMV